MSLFSGIMSTVMSQPPPKEDEEEEDEEQGEEFTFEDTDEEKLQEDGKGTDSGAVGSVQVSKQDGGETLKTDAGSAQTSPPAGQEGAANTDVASVSTAGKHISRLIFLGAESIVLVHLLRFQSSGSAGAGQSKSKKVCTGLQAVLNKPIPYGLIVNYWR